MEFIIIASIDILFCILIKNIFEVNVRKIKELVENEKSKHIDEITQKYPNNIEICKWYLKKLNNESVQIEENSEKNNCLYIALTNKIIIANVRNSYTRIQTIAHECLHSIQGKKLLMANFVFSNVYILYFLVIAILSISKVLQFKMMFLGIFIFLSMIYILIRNYLENDAMIKAKYLAKEYMEEQKISSKDEIEDIVNEFDKINVMGIKATNYKLFLNNCVKILILCVLFIIF